MRNTLLESLTHGSLTEPAPAPDEAALAELAKKVDRAAQAKLGRSLAIRQVDAGSCNGCELEIHRDGIGHAAHHGIAARKNTAVYCAAADRHHPLRIGGGVVSPQQRLTHVFRHRSRHHEHIGMARRGDEAQAEPFEVIERVCQSVDFELAAVAGTGIDLADRQRAAKAGARCPVDVSGQLGECGFAGCGRRLGERPLDQAFQ